MEKVLFFGFLVSWPNKGKVTDCYFSLQKLNAAVND